MGEQKSLSERHFDGDECSGGEFTEKRVRRIAANYPRVNSLLISTHDAKWAVSRMDAAEAERDRLRSALAEAQKVVEAAREVITVWPSEMRPRGLNSFTDKVADLEDALSSRSARAAPGSK